MSELEICASRGRLPAPNGMPLSVTLFWSAPSPRTENPSAAPSSPGISVTPGSDAAIAAMSPCSSGGRFASSIVRSVPLTSGVWLVAVHALLVRRRADHRVELHDGEARVGDQHVFIGHALDLELAEVVADERVAHDVVAGPVGERDLEAPCVVRARFAGDVAGNRRGRDAHAGQRQALGVRHSTANDVGLARELFAAPRRLAARSPTSAKPVTHERRATESNDDGWRIEAPTMRVVDAEANP